MPSARETSDLQNLLHQIEETTRSRDSVPLGDLLDAVGRRSYGPLLLLVGLITVSPLSGIPGVPTTTGILIVIVSVQLLMRRDHFWLPDWIMRRSLSRSKLTKALRWMRKPARVVDHAVRPRLVPLTGHFATYAIAALCLIIALTMPPLEVLPFAASLAGVALSIFGLALVARDGLLVLIAALFTGLIAWLGVSHIS